jgi:hypothetical protein
MRGVAYALVFAAVAGCPGRAWAQESPAAACEARARGIAAALDADSRRMRVWYWGWMAAGAALIAGQAVLAGVVEGDQRTEFIAGSATSVLIPTILLVHPPFVLSDAPALDARLQATTVGGTLGDPCIALDRARELLARDAQDAALSTGWLAHALAIGVNVGVGLLLGVVYDDWWGAAKQTIGGIAVGELQILTFPTGALRAQANLGSLSAGTGSLGALGFGGTF